MSDHPPLRRCDDCEAPAVVRFTVSQRRNSPRAAFRDQSHHRCPAHCPTFDQAYLWGLGATERVVVLDPAFTRQVLGIRPPFDDATRPFPPIGKTVRRRPPAPAIRELRGAELLRALADAIEGDEADSVTSDETRFVPGRRLTDAEAELLGPEPRGYDL